MGTEAHNGRLAVAAGWLRRHFLATLAGAYLVAALAPAAGLWLRGLRLGSLGLFGGRAELSLPSLLLAVLLFNAGLGVDPARLLGAARRPFVLGAGLLANLLVPLLYILGVAQTLRLWHNPEEVQFILVGLALVASMPVAGSSTAWSQNANGDLVLSLGLVLLSTCLSPLTTPALLHAIGWVASGVYAEHLHRLAGGGTSAFLTLFVLAPSLAGVAARSVLGAARARAAAPGLKVVNALVLLVLCYANAAVALPRTVANPDWDFLGVLLVLVTGLCVIGFAAGAAVARLTGADEGQRASLMFGLGMNNNGTGLVLAATALAQLPDVLLAVIFYNLVQHLVAAAVDRWRPRPQTPEPPLPLPAPRPLPEVA